MHQTAKLLIASAPSNTRRLDGPLSEPLAVKFFDGKAALALAEVTFADDDLNSLSVTVLADEDDHRIEYAVQAVVDTALCQSLMMDVGRTYTEIPTSPMLRRVVTGAGFLTAEQLLRSNVRLVEPIYPPHHSLIHDPFRPQPSAARVLDYLEKHVVEIRAFKLDFAQRWLRTMAEVGEPLPAHGRPVTFKRPN